MTFLNAIMLAGLTAVAIPVIIHLLHRRRAEVLDWGAMRFLLAGLASRNRRIRLEELLLLAVRCLLVALIVLAMARPFIRSGPAGGSSEPQDIAIVIDGSLSMTVRPGGKGSQSNFERAVDEARALVAACPKGDAVSLFLAGATVRPIIAEPTHDLSAAAAAIAGLSPTLGPLGPQAALEAAERSLSAGANTSRRIVLFTDGQAVNWDLGDARRWAARGGAGPGGIQPVVIVRTLPMPREWDNLAVGPVRLSRPVVGTDRPVGIACDITNTGTGRAAPGEVVVSIDGRARPPLVLSRELEPGASEAAELSFAFESPGPHEVAVRLAREDDLAGDNDSACVVEVREGIEVLIVDGAAGGSPAGVRGGSAWRASAGELLEIALTRTERAEARPLFRTRVVPAADAASVADFAPFALVVLADVPRLPAALADRLSEFVARGGGLLIAPGEQAQADFYNRWAARTGRRVAPAELLPAAETPPDGGAGAGSAATNPTGRAAAELSLPGLIALADPARYDLNKLVIRRHWRLGVREAEPNVAIGGIWSGGDPLLAERPLGAGRVIMLAVPLDGQWSNLPALRCFVPFCHELAYELSPRGGEGLNLRSGEPFVREGGAAEGRGALEVVDPSGHAAPAETNEAAGRGGQVRYAATDSAGLYLLRPAGGPTAATAPAAAMPFAVLPEPKESVLSTLKAEDFLAARRPGGFRVASSPEELSAAANVPMGGTDLWWMLALSALAVTLGEIALSRWVSRRRRTHEADGAGAGTIVTASGLALGEAGLTGRSEAGTPAGGRPRRGTSMVRHGR